MRRRTDVASIMKDDGGVGWWKAGLIGALSALILSGCNAQPPLSLTMTSRDPLSIVDCIREMQRYGSSVLAAEGVCTSARARPWFHGVLTNRGEGVYPTCTARGFDRSGDAVFDGPVALGFGGFPAGLFAKGHATITFDWYLESGPRLVHSAIVRYEASCVVNTNPPI